MIFELLCIIHVLIWAFVILAFLDIRTAKINLYYVIPAIYILHILPVHILEKTKENIDPEHYKERENTFYSKMVIPGLFLNFQDKLSKFCTASPISGQGMLIFGAITSAIKLK